MSNFANFTKNCLHQQKWVVALVSPVIFSPVLSAVLPGPLRNDIRQAEPCPLKDSHPSSYDGRSRVRKVLPAPSTEFSHALSFPENVRLYRCKPVEALLVLHVFPEPFRSRRPERPCPNALGHEKRFHDICHETFPFSVDDSTINWSTW